MLLYSMQDTVAQRARISPGELFRLFKERFAQRRPPECMSCRLPLPYVVARESESSHNWKIGDVTDCPSGCHAVIAQIAAELGKIYDLRDGSLPAGARDP